MSKHCFITKLPRVTDTLASSECNGFVIQSTWLPSEISIVLLCQVSEIGYTGHLAHSQLELTAKRLEIPFDNFLADTKAAITQSSSGPYRADFVYELKDCTFTWRKVVSDQLKIIYGSVSLVASPRIQFDLLNTLLDQQQSQQDEAIQMACETKRLLEANTKLQEVLENCLAEKRNLEEVLFRKFLTLINGKKNRIRELEDELRAQQQDLQRLSTAKTSGGSVNRVNHLANDDDSTDESDTEYRDSQRSHSSLTARLNSDSSQPSQEQTSMVLPKRIQIASHSNNKTSEVSKPNASENDDPKSPLPTNDSSKHSSAELYECDTQNMIGDM